MLDFRRADGSLKERAIYAYVKKHSDDLDVKQILSFPGNSVIAKYKNYLKSCSGISVDEKVETLEGVKEQEFDYENQVGFSSAILNFKKSFTEDELLKQHGYDVTKWRVVKHQCSKWNCGSKVLMASKIFVKPRNILEGSPATIMENINKALSIKPKPFEVKISKRNSKLLVLPISDLHYGLISDSNTSDNIYNMHIAERRLQEYVMTALDNVNLGENDTILITFGNDYFNCDNVAGTTAHGTPQDNEASYFSIFDKGVNLGVSIIEYLLTYTKCAIRVAAVQGNHDLQSSHAMSLALYFKYKGNPRVNVNVKSDEKARFYFTYGANLIGFGHETNIKDCHRIMSSECKDWSNYKYRTMFLGHLHKEEVYDTGALVARRLPILSGKSKWSDSMGFTSHPRAQAFVFDSEKGLVNTINVEVL